MDSTQNKTTLKRGDNDQIIANIVNAGFADLIPGTMERLAIGQCTYGHGVMVDSDTTQYGTTQNNWVEMANEELYDGIIYLTAEEIRQERKGKKNINIQRARELLAQAVRILASDSGEIGSV